MVNTIQVNAENFEKEVLQSSVPVLVDFWAPWCGPCRQMAPAFEAVSKELSLQVQCLKVNTEEDQGLGALYGIESIPTLVMFKEGKEVERSSGALPKEALMTWAKRFI